MNPTEADLWKSVVLDEVFEALAESAELTAVMVFKGARVLNIRLGGGRQSLDIDSNLRQSFVNQHPDRREQREWLEREMSRTIRRHFESREPVQFELNGLRLRQKPPTNHPRGWNAFETRININDLTKQVKGLPALRIDLAAPEELLEDSLAPLTIGSRQVWAYTLERIAGEKLRAFLSSLPSHRKKMQ